MTTGGAAGVGSTFGRVAVGHPIDVASGEFFTNDIDHELPGVVPISLGRTFNTRFVRKPVLERLGESAATWLPFGPGWRPTWFAELRQTLSGFLYTRADGVEFRIGDPLGDKRLSRTGRIFSPADGLEVQRVSDTRLRVIGYGRDRNEFTLVFEAASGKHYRLVSIERTREGRLDILYDESGRPIHLIQRRERRGYELVYDGDRVARAKLHLADRTVRVVAEYAYDGRGRLASVTDSRGLAASYGYDDANRIVREEHRGGSVYTVQYGSDGRCEYAAGANGYQERRLRYDTHARKTWVWDSHGEATVYEWNDQGQVIKTTTPCKVVTHAEFDDHGRPIRETGANGEMTEFVYDERGRLHVQREYGGIETTFHHDDEHRLVAYEDAFEGEVVTHGRFTYDADHNLTSAQVNDHHAWKYGWTAFGELESTMAPSGATALRRYDSIGGLERATNWDGQAWTWSRDALGRVITETNPLGHTWHVEYLDADGQSLRVREPDGRVYTREVSQDERSIVQRLPGNRSRSVELSFCGNPIAICDEIGAVTHLQWGSEPGELVAITNANYADYTFTYDADMRLVERRTFDGRVLRSEWTGTRVAASYDGMGRRTEYEYDFRGLITKQTNEDGETKLEYDKLGLLASVQTPSSTSRIFHDDLGRVIAEEQDGIRIERPVDEMGRPIAHKTPFGVETTFTWSNGGRLNSLRHGDAEVTFERDAVGRETRRHLGSAGVFEQAYDSIGRLVSQAFYGKAARRTSSSGPSAPGVLRHFGFDERGFLASIEDSLRGPTRLHHNDRGDLTGVIRQNGWSDFYEFDACQNRVYHATTQHGAALAAALDAARREQGNIPVDRVASRFPHFEQSFGFERGDRIVVIARADAEIHLTYDANGQVISKTAHRGSERTTWRYAWNARGELTAVTTPNGKVWRYSYDPSGRRIEKRSPTGDTWRFLWMGALLSQTLKNGELAESYVHEPGGTCPLLRDDGQIYFILPDQNDAPSEEVAADSTITWTARKGTWGDSWPPHGPTGGEPFLGQWHDAESGLHYNLFRYYDPETGRYLSPDPIGLLGGINGYLCTSDPVSIYDRFGLCETDPPPTPRQPSQDPETAEGEQATRMVDPRRLRATEELSSKSQAVKMSKLMGGEKGFGPFDPIDGVDVDGALYVVDGHHRTAAALRAKLPQVPVRVRPPISPDEGSELFRSWASTLTDR